MLASRTMLAHLVEHQEDVYPRLAALGERCRRMVEAAFTEEGICARCTGWPSEVMPGSSLAMLHFPYDDCNPLHHPDEVNDPALCDVVLQDKVLRLAMLLENVSVLHGLGSLTTAHSNEDMAFLIAACHRVARRIGPR
jgi:glutamate-1-semialdehyde aminotransferase